LYNSHIYLYIYSFILTLSHSLTHSHTHSRSMMMSQARPRSDIIRGSHTRLLDLQSCGVCVCVCLVIFAQDCS